MPSQQCPPHTWKYKERRYRARRGELEKWLRTIKEILDDPQPDAMDFLDTIKLNLFASEIFVFTPKGEIKTMPQNCTALDFAFLSLIHLAAIASELKSTTSPGCLEPQNCKRLTRWRFLLPTFFFRRKIRYSLQ